MRRLLCWIGWHRWARIDITDYAAFYGCRRCGSEQVDFLGNGTRVNGQLASDVEEGR